MTTYEPVEMITVNPDDMTAAERENPSHCAVAKHIQRAHPDLTHVKVGKESISATSNIMKARFTWATPLSVKKAIQKF